MGHQAGKCQTPEERDEAFEWIGDLEFGKLGLPLPDAKIFLHMPTDYSLLLKQGRSEKADEHERDTNHLKNAEQAYVELAEKYGFETISCIRDEEEKVSEENTEKTEEPKDVEEKTEQESQTETNSETKSETTTEGIRFTRGFE